MKVNASTNSLLGYPSDARLLIINTDDFGMCHGVNEAVMQVLQQGLGTSCTIMVPCPWYLHGVQLLKEASEIPFGVHLTTVSEQPHYRWRPLLSREKIPSLIDEAGYFYPEHRIDQFLTQVDLRELEAEFRAQIETILATGLQPTHLDSHCGIHSRRDVIFDLTVRLAQEYGLALRVSQKAYIEK